MSVDTSQLKSFTERLKTLAGTEKDQFIADTCNEMGNRVLAKTIKNTRERIYQKPEPKHYKRTQNFLRGWMMKPANKNGKGFVCEVYNDVPYSVYLEYGHRTKDHKGWVEGKFMLTDATFDVIHQDNPELAENLKKYLREKINGGNRD